MVLETPVPGTLVGNNLKGKQQPLLAVLAIEKVPHSLASGRVRSLVTLQNIRRLRLCIRLLFTASGTAIRKSRLSRL
jgi:hypothetical protein